MAELGALPRSVWLRSLRYATVAALLIAIPSDLIPNPVFGRPVPIRAIDYVIWVISSLLIGLVLAIRRDDREDEDDSRPLWGGLLSFLAVGCPSCNQLVVVLVGTSGALSWWAPIQPLVGMAAIGLLVVALRKRLATYGLDACPLPGSMGDAPDDAAVPASERTKR